jgi:Cu/Zn superoxide dismutase
VIIDDPVQTADPAGQGFKRTAEATLVSSGRGGNIQGNLTFRENDEGVLIRGVITGLELGNHGFHVHMVGDTGDGCLAAGPHFNPFNVSLAQIDR